MATSEQRVAERSALLKWLEKHMVDWRKRFPGLEQKLAQHLLPFLPGAAPLRLEPPQKLHWLAYRHAINWTQIRSIIYVNPESVNNDLPPFSLTQDMNDSITGMLESYLDENDLIEMQGQRHFFTNLAYDFFFHVQYLRSSGRTKKTKERLWDVGAGLGTVKREWITGRQTVVALLDQNLNAAVCLAVYWLLGPPSVLDPERAWLLLKMWASGNYPIGFDAKNNLYVLAQC